MAANFINTSGNIIANSGNFTTLTINGTSINNFNENIDDRVNSLLVAGTGINLSYNDNSNALTINLASSAVSGYEILTSNKSIFTVSQGYLSNNLNVYVNGSKLILGEDYTASNGSTFTLTQTAASGDIIEWQGLGGPAAYSELNHTHSSSDITNFNSSVSGLLPVKNITAGSGIGITSVNENFTINVTGSFGLTSEEVDDRVSNLLVAGTGISLNYDDNANNLTIDLSSSSIKGYEILTSNKNVFTVTQGYLVNNLNVYINGVKLLDGVDYTATNGSTFTLTETAVSGNIVEWNGLGGVASYVTNISGSGNIIATNNNGSFTISSSGLIKSDTTGIIGASGVSNIVVISKADYDSIVTKNSTTLYYIV